MCPLPDAGRSHAKIVKTLHADGVRNRSAGTDAPMPLVYPGFALHKELELLVEAGMSPADALRAATIWPAEFLGLSDRSGSVAVGKRADLLLLDDNPLSGISHTSGLIRAVVLDGRLLQRSDLDALLDTARSQAKLNPQASPANLSRLANEAKRPARQSGESSPDRRSDNIPSQCYKARLAERRSGGAPVG